MTGYSKHLSFPLNRYINDEEAGQANDRLTGTEIAMSSDSNTVIFSIHQSPTSCL